MTAIAAQRVVAGFLLEAMSNLRPNTTGVQGAVIWISAGEFAGTSLQHGPRVKVVLGDKITTEGLADAVSVRISKPPKVLGTLPGRVRAQVIRFVTKNHDVLLKHWNGDLDAKETLDQLQSI